jgi:hypothetical protein
MKHKRYSVEVNRDLVEWMRSETEPLIEARYVELGRIRAQQEVPFSHLFWAVCITRDFLCDYIQQECLIDDPVEFWGGVILLRSLNQFFDPALYFTCWLSERQYARIHHSAYRSTIEVVHERCCSQAT